MATKALGPKPASHRTSLRPYASGPDVRLGVLGAEEAGREPGLRAAARAVRLDPEGGAVGPVAHDLLQGVVDVVRADAVLAGESAGQLAFRDQLMVERAALRLG